MLSPRAHRDLHLTKGDNFDPLTHTPLASNTTPHTTHTTATAPTQPQTQPQTQPSPTIEAPIPNYILLPTQSLTQVEPAPTQQQSEYNTDYPPLTSKYIPLDATSSSSSSTESTEFSSPHDTNNTNTNTIPQLNFDPDLHLQWGDSPTADIKNHPYFFRFLHYNTKGVRPIKEPELLEADLTILKNLHPLVVSINELNFDTTQTKYTNAFKEQMHKTFDRYSTAQFASSPEPSNSEFKMGGEAILARGQLATGIKTRGKDPGGRWTWITYTGRKNRNLTIVSAYQVCRGPTKGLTTIYNQQVRYLTSKGHVNPNPRTHFLQDLASFIQHQHKQQNQIILLLDANDGLLTDSNNTPSHLKQFLLSTGMIHAMQTAYPDASLPITYKEGRRCLDHILLSPSLLDSIRAVGALPLHSGINTDHRLIFTDLDLSHFFGHWLPDPLLALPQLLQTNTSYKWQKYITTIKEYYQAHNIQKRAIKYTTNIRKAVSTENRNYWILQFDKLDQERTRLQEKAESSLGSKLYNPPPWSPQLIKTISILRYWENRLSQHDLELPLSQEFVERGRQLGIEDLELQEQDDNTRDYIQDQLDNAKNNKMKDKKNAPKLRAQHQQELAEYYESIGKGKQATIVKQIKKYKQVKRTHAKHGAYLKPKKKGMLRYLLIPSKDNKWTTISDPVKMFQHLLHKNTHHLFKLHICPFTTGELAEDIGPTCNGPLVEDILQGTYTMAASYKARPDFKELRSFVKAMQYAVKPNGERAPEMDVQFTVKDYQTLFKKSREYIAVHPKIHMGHHIAAAEDEYLATTNTIFINTPFQCGFSLTRWQRSIHCMLQKKEQPWIHKLQIIQLFEADFNAGLKFFFAKHLMQHCVKHDILNNQNHGSKPENTVHDALLIQTLHYYLVRITRTPFNTVFNDADGCYDRVRPNLLTIASRRRGCPPPIAICQGETQNKIRHKIRTSYGISKQHIEPHPLRGGIGQRGSYGPFGWDAHLDIIAEALKNHSDGCVFTTPDLKRLYHSWLCSFVDDDQLYQNNFKHYTLQYQIHTFISAILSWQRLLKSTGGDLSVDKCLAYIIRFQFNQNGKPTIQKIADAPGDIILTQDNGTIEEIERLEPDDAERALGVRLAPTGQFNTEFNYREENIREFCGRLKSAHPTPQDTEIIYTFRWKPIVSYCLPITRFTPQQCERLMIISRRALLPKLGFNQNSPLPIIHGPHIYGGSNRLHIRTLQATLHILYFLGHYRQRSHISDQYKILLDISQLTLGVGFPILEYPSIPLPHEEMNHITFLRRQLSHLNLHIKLTDPWIPPLVWENDCYLMESFLTISMPTKYLEELNYCRLYLQVITLANIVTPDGKYIQEWAYQGHKQQQSNLSWPIQQRPSNSQWQWWQRHLRKLFITGPRQLLRPLGQRLNAPWHQSIQQAYEPLQDILFIHNGIGWDKYAYNYTTHRYCLSFELQPVLQLPPNAQLTQATPSNTGYTLTNTTPSNASPAYPRLTNSPIDYATFISSEPSSYRHLYPQQISPIDHQQLIESYESGQILGALSTTITGTKGFFCYSITTPTNHTTILHYGAITSSHNNISNKRTELTAFLSLMLLTAYLHATTAKHIPLIVSSNSIYLKTIIQDMEKWGQLPNQHLLRIQNQDNYDILSLIHHLYLRYNHPIVLQPNPSLITKNDELIIDGQGMHDDLKNVTIEQFETTPTHHNLHHIHTSQATLWNQQFLLHTNIPHLIHHYSHGPQLIEYLLERNHWTPTTFQQIAWQPFEAFMQGQTSRKRTLTCKYVHDWQNVGTQKEKIDEATTESCCPMECGKTETPMHFWYCDDPALSGIREDLLRTFEEHLQTNKTAPTVTHTIMQCISYWIHAQETYPILVTRDEHGQQDALSTAVHSQNEIGWEHFLKGRFSIKWLDLQHKYCKEEQLPPTQDGFNGEKLTIEQIIKISLQLWEYRNKILRGFNYANTMLLKRQQITAKIRLSYQHSVEVEPHFFHLFDKPLNHLFKHTISYLQAWQFTYAYRF